jgi:hypothetical protein
MTPRGVTVYVCSPILGHLMAPKWGQLKLSQLVNIQVNHSVVVKSAEENWSIFQQDSSDLFNLFGLSIERPRVFICLSNLRDRKV